MGCCPSSNSCIEKLTLSPSTMSAVSCAGAAQLSQFGKEVMHFSSQYGGDGSRAYVAVNMAGPPSVFPNYGDFTQACVFRTYGKWWEAVPSAEKPFDKKGAFRGTDFIDLYFEEKVIPSSIKVYETYHPGAVIQIFAAEIERLPENGGPVQPENIRWHELWSGEAQGKHFQPQMFSPPLKHTTARTNLLRLVFDHRQCEYYTELDSVELVGMTTTSSNDDGTDLDEVYIQHMEKLSLRNDKKLMSHDYPVQALPPTDNGCFDMLPGELIQIIFNYLSLDDLCQAATTCTLFKRHCYDQLLYVELNLQPYWHLVSNDTLQGLTAKCSQLQKLDLSWCGDWGKIADREFISFLEACGGEVKVLRMKACSFVTEETLEAIAKTCLNLTELNIASCRGIKSKSYGCLQSLTNLEILNLYRSTITEGELIEILRKTPRLRHLNLGAVRSLANMDNVAQELGRSCPLLESLDTWRSKTLSFLGISCIAAGCPNLLELDVGWCSDLRGNTSWVKNLVVNCSKLRKLFLTSVRSIADGDLYHIASNLSDLEQLDLLGAQRVTQQGVARVLEKCPKLVFLDVSFCQQLTLDVVTQLNDRYPLVAIKKSFTM